MGWWNRAKVADSNFSLASWGWSGAKWMFPGTVAALMSWAAAYRDWIWNNPGWFGGMLGVLSIGLVAAFVASAALALSGLGFRAFRATRVTQAKHPTEPSAPLGPSTGQGNESQFSEQAHNDLVRFAATWLLPACRAQVSLQELILGQADLPKFIRHLAQRGLQSNVEHRQFVEKLDRLSGLTSSPATDLSALELIEIIGCMENDAYAHFCGQRDDLAREIGIDYKSNDATSLAWRKWVKLHNDVISNYESIKTNRAFNTAEKFPNLPSLWRPVRPSRWGEIEA